MATAAIRFKVRLPWSNKRVVGFCCRCLLLLLKTAGFSFPLFFKFFQRRGSIVLTVGMDSIGRTGQNQGSVQWHKDGRPVRWLPARPRTTSRAPGSMGAPGSVGLLLVKHFLPIFFYIGVCTNDDADRLDRAWPALTAFDVFEKKNLIYDAASCWTVGNLRHLVVNHVAATAAIFGSAIS